MIKLASVVCFVITLIGYAHAAEVVYFNMLDDLPVGASTWQQPLAMSADGAAIALHGDTGFVVAPRGWVWSPTDGFEPVPDHVSYPFLETISGDGSVTAAVNFRGDLSILWNREEQVVTPLDFGVTLLSEDGTVAAGSQTVVDAFGFTRGEAVHWTTSGGVQSLGLSEEWSEQRPLGMSADGRTIVGWLADERFQTPSGVAFGRSDGFIWHDGNVIELGLPYVPDHKIAYHLFCKSQTPWRIASIGRLPSGN